MKLSLDHLPKTARDLVDLIGLPAALRFIEAYRGRTLQVAHGKRSRGMVQIQELAEKIGAVAAKKIVARYKGGPLAVPKCWRAMIATRDAALQGRFDELTASGAYSARRAVALLVGEFDLVESSIWRALKRPSGAAAVRAAVADTTQMGLFA